MTATTRIKRLRIQNFRCFADLVVDFDDELTVLVALNGGGKSAVLDAIAIGWRLFVDAISDGKASSGFAHQDVRRVIDKDRAMSPVTPLRLEVWGKVAGHGPPKNSPWLRELTSVAQNAKTTWKPAAQLREVGVELRREVIAYAENRRTTAPLLPVIAYYGTGRIWDTHKLTSGKKTDHGDTSRFSGYIDCLSPKSSFRFFEDWFGRFASEANHAQATGTPSPHQPRERLKAVQQAVGEVLASSGWRDLDWDFVEGALVATHPDHGRLPVRLLSDGIRTMIGLVGDLAHRCVRLNPHLGARAALETPGIVLIDEVDMHLHPAWQQQVIGSLRAAFPKVQLIVTTHSPQVLSTVEDHHIRVLSSDRVAQHTTQSHPEED